MTKLPLVPLQEREKPIIPTGRRAWPPPISQISTVNQIYPFCPISAFHLPPVDALATWEGHKPTNMSFRLGQRGWSVEGGWLKCLIPGWLLHLCCQCLGPHDCVTASCESISIKCYFNRIDYVNERKDWNSTLNSGKMCPSSSIVLKILFNSDVNCFRKKTQ